MLVGTGEGLMLIGLLTGAGAFNKDGVLADTGVRSEAL